MTSRALGHRAPLLWVLLPLMGGLAAGKLDWIPLPPLVCCLVAIGAIITAFVSRRLWTPALIAGVFFSGAAYYELRRDRLEDWDSLPPREARLTLEIQRMFPQQADFDSVSGLGLIIATDPHLRELAGQRVYVSLTPRAGDSSPTRSSRLAVTGLLQPLPRNPSLDTFDGYLAGLGMNFKLTRARVTGEVVEAGAYRLFCDAALRKFNRILGHGIEAHPEQTGVLRAMLLGQQQELADAQKKMFRESGTMHLFSISGLHIAVIAAVITGLLSVFRIPALPRLLIGGALLWLYVDITGGTPSAVRAWVMVMFLHASYVLRVPGNPIAALAASALCVLLVSPLQLFTASFQLSYGIVASLLMLGLPLSDWLNEKISPFRLLPRAAWRWYHRAIASACEKTLSSVAIGLSTTVVGMISGVVIFGLFTPVSLFANLLLIPLGSLVIVVAFISLVVGLLGFGWLSLLLNHAGVLLLKIIDALVRFFVDLPGAYHEATFPAPALGYAAFAALIAVILHGYAANWELRRGGYWVPFVYTAAALALGMRFSVA